MVNALWAALVVTVSLSLAIVVYHPDQQVLDKTGWALVEAIDVARAAQRLDRVSLFLVDNQEITQPFDGAPWATSLAGHEGIDVTVLSGHGNLGYGCGHNLAIAASDCDYHLVLNPDAFLAPDALLEALGYLAQHPQVALLSPASRRLSGEVEYLCKRYPSLIDLGLRGFSPSFLRALCATRLARYAYQDETDAGEVFEPVLVSGCFMLGRTTTFRAVGGFCDDYFMYFEDFDLSLRMASQGLLVHVPAVRIVHAGGGAARKGWRHRALFMRSAFTFYRKHGLRIGL